jgi:hypothetical protein
MEKLGFIILRHVNSQKTDLYWKHSYTCVRKYHPEAPIMIIDDNSKYDFIDCTFQEQLTNTTVIDSEYPGRGELLPYYYYLQNPLFETAVILHDSAFLNSNIDFTVDNYAIMWTFEHNCDQPADEVNILRHLDNSEELLTFHANRKNWKGCFGGMSVIKHDFLKRINSRHNIAKMLPYVRTRYNRMSFERVSACLLQAFAPTRCMFGNIHAYCRFGGAFEQMSEYRHLPIIKVWSGR